MESQPQNPEFSNNPDNFTHALSVFLSMKIVSFVCIFIFIEISCEVSMNKSYLTSGPELSIEYL